MRIIKKLWFCLLFVGFFASVPLSYASADSGRYFVKSTKGFWKNTFGVRHIFDNGFSTELSDFQIRLAKMFGVEIEPITVAQILGDETLADKDDALVTPSPTAIPTPKSIKGPKGAVRYLPSDQTPWGIETIYDDPQVASTSGGLNINVAILDTGASVNHPDLKARIGQCKDFTSTRSPVLDNKCEDKNGHGTHVAGIVAADSGADGLGIYGVAPAAKLMVYKVCGANGSCYADDIAAALRTAADLGANVVNMSFGTDKDSSLIREAVNYASSKGVLMVAAAGNDGPFPESIDYPAAYSQVVAVGAVSPLLKVTDWSSRGINLKTKLGVIEEKDIEFATPGESIESTWNNNGYMNLSGTSMAAPFVSGLAAKYWQTPLGDIVPAQATRDYLKSLSVDIPPLGEDNDSGYGMPMVK